MRDEIIEQGPGYTIAITDEAGTLTNYSACVRPDGTINHGFLDLRDQPELVNRIPEAAKSEGLAEILRVANAKGSPFFTIGCECHEFQVTGSRPDGSKMYVAGFASISLRNQDKASVKSTMIDFVRWVLGGLGAPPDGAAVSFEFIVEPMTWHFGRHDCYSVMLKPFGYGRTSEEAWTAFGAAANMVAQSLARANTDSKPET